jgi:hypothetical protein
LTDPNTIEGPGALILVASCEPILSAVGLSVSMVCVDFPTMKWGQESLREITGVRISAAKSTASQVRSTPARAESRDATERSRAGSRSTVGRCRPAQADGGRSEGARPSLCAGAASFRRFTRPRRSSAARRGFVMVGDLPRVSPRVDLAGVSWLADATGPRAWLASLTPVQTLPFWGKENSVPLKKNTGVFL